MSDIAHLNLTEPAQVNWKDYGKTYIAPPPALDASGKFLTYYGVCSNPVIEEEMPDTDADGNPLLTFLLDPIKIVKSGQYDGTEIRFTRASTRVYTNPKTGLPKKGNPNRLADYLRATGSQGQPQLNAEYIGAVKMSANKPFPFSLDWEARNKETNEVIRGYRSFPEDPDRPGFRKSILKKGDFYSVYDKQGNLIETKQVEAEVLFANARLKFFRDPSKGQVQG